MEMFTIAAEEAAKANSHSVLSGTVTRDGAPVAATLTLSRSFDTPYSSNGGARDVGSLTAMRTELAETQAKFVPVRDSLGG